MAKAIDGQLRTRISITEGDERSRYQAARTAFVMKNPQAAAGVALAYGMTLCATGYASVNEACDSHQR